jgi:hypothetical protein
MPANQVSSPSSPRREADSSREKRIATVAWRWNRQYRYDVEYAARGFSDQEIREGDALGQAMEDEYSKNRRCFGDPAYGSWPAHAQQPIRNKVRAMLRGESEPSATPAARTITELRKLEQLIPTCGAARFHRLPEAA